MGLDLPDLSLTRDRFGNLLTAEATLTTGDDRTWVLGNLGTFTDQPGTYQLRLIVEDSGIQSLSGDSLADGDTVSWTDIRQAGDANTDGRFDQLDIVQVLQAAKYLTAEAADFSEGDWNGDGVFDQLDIVAALQTGNYLQGPYAVYARNDDSIWLSKNDDHRVIDEIFKNSTSLDESLSWQ